jgi:hypothetical protein
VSKPEPFSLTDWQDQAHKANCLKLTPKRTRNGSGAFHALGGFFMAPNARRKKRKAYRLAGYINRAALRPVAETDSPEPAAAPTTSTPKPSAFGRFMRKFSRMFGGAK